MAGSAPDPTPTGGGQRTARLVTYELLSGLTWLPTVAAALLLLIALPTFGAWLADVERARAQRLGELPAGPTRRADESLRAWLVRRRASGRLFSQDVALFAIVTLMGLPSMVLAAVFVVAALLIPLQLLMDPSRVVMTANGAPMAPWAKALVAAIAAVVAVAGLRGLAALRLRIVRALSRDPEADLADRIGALERGRATLVSVFEAERRRIERDLHDGAQQQLVALALELGHAELAAAALPDSLGEPVLAAVARAHDRAEAALARLRESVRRIHPAVLADRGLFAGIEDLVAHAGFPVALSCSGDDARVSAPSAAAAYFAVAEALTNVARHAGGQGAAVAVDVPEHADEVRLRVTDRGPGGADPSRGSGLAGLAERMDSLGGALAVESVAGSGTTLSAVLPLLPRWPVPEGRGSIAEGRLMPVDRVGTGRSGRRGGAPS